MKFFVRVAVLTAIAVVSTPGFAVTLNHVVLSKSPTDDPCNPGTPVSAFAATDPRVTVFVDVDGAAVGDLLKIEWLSPDGQVYRTSTFTPVPSPGGYCFAASIGIAGNQAASLPGTWTVRGLWNNSQLFTQSFTIGGAVDTGNTLTIDAKANIFAAGRATVFNGVQPPVYRLTAGSGKMITFSGVTGSVGCWGPNEMNGPDGSTTCAGGKTNITSYQGISGIIHNGKAMFLVGVFLTDATPADPAPARLDFSSTAVPDSFTSLTPAIGQTFFIGDGLTGTGAGSKQQFYVPATATRLFLGIADASGFQGAPCCYEDNVGSMRATIEVGTGTPPPTGDTNTLTINGQANIYAAGRATAFNGVLPALYRFTAASGRVFTFANVTGSVRCSPGASFNGPDGSIECGGSTDITPYQGISGIVHGSRTLFLVGVFLTDATPADPAPARLDFSTNDNTFLTLSPQIGQVFFIGDGLTSSRVKQQFYAPSTATRLYLGFADAYSFHGAPGYYDDNSGSLTATVELNAGTPPPPAGGPKITTTPASLDFGSVALGQNKDLTLSIGNSGGSNLTVSAMTATDAQFTVVTSPFAPTVPFTVSPGSQQGVTVRFTPSFTGAQSAGLNISSNDTSTPSLRVPLSGTGTGGTGPGPTCNYYVRPTSQTIAGSGGTGLILIDSAQGCTWSASTNDSWITIEAGKTGTGNGAVSYRAAANPGSSERRGTVTVGGGGQTFPHTVIQSPGGAPCTYTLTPTGAPAGAAGGPGNFYVNTGSTCTWQATTATTWITITTASTGPGPGMVNYLVAANTATSPRDGSIAVADQRFTVSQAGASAGPVISPGGIVNAASNKPADFPGGGVARGSYFTIYGASIGPAQYAQATTYPIPTTLGDVSVRVGSVDAYVVFASSTQINAIMPSNAPLGDVQVSVTYKGQSSTGMKVKVVNTNFGAFSTVSGRGPGIIQNYVSATDVPLNMPTATAKPGQIAILWGTGLGPIQGGDNVAPPAGDMGLAVQVYVGGKMTEKPQYAGRAPNFAGVDNIYFKVPSDAPQGCYVPVQVRVGDAWSNTVRMAIEGSGQQCQDPANPYSTLAANGGKTGSIILMRAGIFAPLETGKPPSELTLDLGIGAFVETKAGGALAYSSLYSLPPPGACVSISGNLDLNSLLGGALGGTGGVPADPTTGGQLDAGAKLTITGPKGSVDLPRLEGESNLGTYVGLLGGALPLSVPLSGFKAGPLFLEKGDYTVSGTGGRHVGRFDARFGLPDPVTWTNRDQISTVNRNSGVTVNWSGGDPNTQMVLIAGGSLDSNTKAAGGFICLAPVSAGSFTVPVSALADVPATGANPSLTDSLGALAVGGLPMGDLPRFTAPGLDNGFVIPGAVYVKTLAYQ